MKILSIDIGKKNLGWCVYSNDDIQFGLFDIEKHIIKKNMFNRNICLIEWFNKMIDERGQFDKVIIEKQVVQNVVAMCIQSCLITISKILLKDSIIICFDPKRKFVGITYNAKKKEHKKIIIDIARTELKLKNKLNNFESFKKKDDISDAIVMAKIEFENNN